MFEVRFYLSHLCLNPTGICIIDFDPRVAQPISEIDRERVECRLRGSTGEVSVMNAIFLLVHHTDSFWQFVVVAHVFRSLSCSTNRRVTASAVATPADRCLWPSQPDSAAQTV